MRIKDLRPGMEDVDLEVKVVKLNEARRVTTHTGLEHTLVEGEVEDETGRAAITVWNERIEQLGNVQVDSLVELRNCFVTSFRGTLHINVGRDSTISPARGG